MAIANIGSLLPSVGGSNAAADGGRLPAAENNRARENTDASSQPRLVSRTNLSLHPDDRIAGLN